MVIILLPIPTAKRCRVRIEGFAFPLSNLLISPCAIPVRSASSFCVRLELCLATSFYRDLDLLRYAVMCIDIDVAGALAFGGDLAAL